MAARTADDAIWREIGIFTQEVIRNKVRSDLSQDTLDELKQDVFEKLHSEGVIEMIVGAKSPTAYFRKVVSNVVSDKYRTEKTRQSLLKNAAFLERTRIDDPSIIAEKNELHQQLKLAIAKLDPTNKKLIEEFYAGGLTVHQLSDKHDLSVTNVTTRLARARQTIANQLKKV
ncbi:protein containing RNA polymerase sigma-70 [Rhodopirellula baltica SWK14]|uniref:Protein containing RNA polymerase sigma-70 n=1 Tax=Rhodopirellula baltica SWK14 TaxID=993516 RepID=L7CL26_RHOBT|nr:protein containing RNA polymerase sigma-70 [Rhodopirellula baltica SWK14]